MASAPFSESDNCRNRAGNDRFVYRTAILDRSRDVRREAMNVTRELGKSMDAIDYLAPGLVHQNARYRMRTASAFGDLGAVEALPLLVAAGPSASRVRRALPGGATRANMSVVQQIAYIRDFDVEVAQASFIADPKVDVIHSGVVLDVTVLAVTTIRRRRQRFLLVRNSLGRWQVVPSSRPG